MSPMARTWWYANSAGKLAAPYQKHQLGVPRLPIPTLEESCARYLRAAQPLQSSADHAKTKQVVADFCKPGGEGELLQEQLKRTDASLPTQSSYVESLWYRLAYLGGRDPVTIGSNPGIVLASPTDPTQRDPFWRAASLLAACMAWKRELDEGTLPPAFAGGKDAAPTLALTLSLTLTLKLNPTPNPNPSPHPNPHPNPHPHPKPQS
jgi:hypothetical protein